GGGQRMAAFLKQVSDHAEAQQAQAGLREFAEPVLDLARRVGAVTSELVELSSDDPQVAGAAAAPYLRLVGHLAVAHLWLRAVQVALPKVGSGDPFYASKVATARFYVRRLLSQTLALCEEIRAGAAPVMDPALLY